MKKCLDCLNLVSDIIYTRCIKCSNKGKNNPAFGKFGKLAPNWKGGLPKCIDCGKRLSSYECKRCKKCNNTRELNPMWIDGRRYLPYSVEFTNK